MATIIKYNGINPFGERTPFISEETVFEDNNGYISEIDRYTLTGTRPRPFCGATLSDYKDDIDSILAIFHLNFKTFELIEDGNTIFSFPECIIRSINFPESSFISFYEYEIVIDRIKSYQGLGIVEPNENFETSQDGGPVTTIKHTISCRGVGPNAITAAKSFIESKRSVILPIAFMGNENNQLMPVTISRVYSINRLTGVVSLDTTYLYNEDDTYPQASTSILTYTCELQESSDGVKINIKGNIQGNSVDGANEMTKAKTRFDALDWQAIAQAEWVSWGGLTTLSDNTQFSVDESPLEAQVSFSMSWDSNSQEGAYLREEWTISRSYDGQPNCFRYKGTVRDDSGCVGDRFTAVKALFAATNFSNRVSILWAQYGTGETLSSTAKTKTVTENPFIGTMSYEIVYCNDPSQNCGCAENMEFSINFEEAIPQYGFKPILFGQGRYSIINLGFQNRRKFTIQGKARKSKCCSLDQTKAAIKSKLNFLRVQYFQGSDIILESAQYGQSDSGDDLSFNYSWSAAA